MWRSYTRDVEKRWYREYEIEEEEEEESLPFEEAPKKDLTVEQAASFEEKMSPHLQSNYRNTYLPMWYNSYYYISLSPQ